MSANGPYKTRVFLNSPGHFHFLTFSCFSGLPLLVDDRWMRLLSSALDSAATRHHFGVAAFVYMPEHVHMLIRSANDNYDLSPFLFAVKRPFSYHVKKALQETNSPLLAKLTVHTRPGKTAFRFWQEGGGYDRNVVSLEAALKTIDYIHNNPVRRGLCTSPAEWRWSSWKYYHKPEEYDTSHLPTVAQIVP